MGEDRVFVYRLNPGRLWKVGKCRRFRKRGRSGKGLRLCPIVRRVLSRGMEGIVRDNSTTYDSGDYSTEYTIGADAGGER